MIKKNKLLILSIASILLLSGCGSDNISTAAEETYMQNDFYYDANVKEYEDNYTSDEMIDDSSETEIYGDKLVYTCSLEIETLEYDETIASIKTKIKNMNGIIESESESDSDYSWYYVDNEKTRGTMNIQMKIRIPTDKYTEFLDSLEGDGKIISKSSNVENISKEYYETYAIIESLKIQEERLLSMMESAETIDDMIAIETRLTEVQTDLNVYNTELSSMDTDINYSTIYINVNEVFSYSPEIYTDTFFDRFLNTISETWEFFWDLLENLLFFVIRIIPIIIVFTPIGFIIRFIFKKIKIKKINKKQKNDVKKSELQ